MAENVQLNNINIRGFKNAIADIKIYGGANRPKKLHSVILIFIIHLTISVLPVVQAFMIPKLLVQT